MCREKVAGVAVNDGVCECCIMLMFHNLASLQMFKSSSSFFKIFGRQILRAIFWLCSLPLSGTWLDSSLYSKMINRSWSLLCTNFAVVLLESRSSTSFVRRSVISHLLTYVSSDWSVETSYDALFERSFYSSSISFVIRCHKRLKNEKDDSLRPFLNVSHSSD